MFDKTRKGCYDETVKNHSYEAIFIPEVNGKIVGKEAVRRKRLIERKGDV